MSAPPANCEWCGSPLRREPDGRPKIVFIDSVPPKCGELWFEFECESAWCESDGMFHYGDECRLRCRDNEIADLRAKLAEAAEAVVDDAAHAGLDLSTGGVTAREASTWMRTRINALESDSAKCSEELAAASARRSWLSIELRKAQSDINGHQQAISSLRGALGLLPNDGIDAVETVKRLLSDLAALRKADEERRAREWTWWALQPWNTSRPWASTSRTSQNAVAEQLAFPGDRVARLAVRVEP